MTLRRVLHAFTMTFIMVGMFYFYTISNYYYDLWEADQTYYAFCKLIDVLLIMCIIFPLREIWREWLCIGMFFAVREVWEAWAIKDYATADRPSIIFLLFCTDGLCLVIIFILRIIKARK